VKIECAKVAVRAAGMLLNSRKGQGRSQAAKNSFPAFMLAYPFRRLGTKSFEL
jgi:hypothetical protein